VEPILQDVNLSAPEAFRLEHDYLRTQLVTASMEPGATGKAAKRVALVCATHFEQEEKHVYPVFRFLHHVAMGDVQADMASVLPLVSRFTMRHARLQSDHKSISTAVRELFAAARKDGQTHIADLAYRLWLHERMDEAVVYPMVILIGNYVRERLRLGPRRNDGSVTP
jgi:hypothetical protein